MKFELCDAKKLLILTCLHMTMWISPSLWPAGGSFYQGELRVVTFFIFDSPAYSHHVMSELLGCNLPVNLLKKNLPIQSAMSDQYPLPQCLQCSMNSI